MSTLFESSIAYLSKKLGLDTVTAFPAGHLYARTNWNNAYFDIASEMTPDQIERALSDAIHNTPSIFAHINNPTPRMQRSFLAVLHDSVRRNDGNTAQWAGLLINAYASSHVHEVLPGLRAEIAATAGVVPEERIRSLIVFLANMAAPFDVIDLHTQI